MSEHSRGRETARLRDGAPAARWAPLERHRRGVRDARRVAEDAPSWSRGRTRAGRAASGARSMRNGSRRATRSTLSMTIVGQSAGRQMRSRSFLASRGGMFFSGRVESGFFSRFGDFCRQRARAAGDERRAPVRKSTRDVPSGLRSASIRMRFHVGISPVERTCSNTAASPTLRYAPSATLRPFP